MLGDLGGESRLADAGLPADQQQLGRACGVARQAAREVEQLVTADERELAVDRERQVAGTGPGRCFTAGGAVDPARDDVGCDEPEAAAVHRLDDRLPLAVVAERTAGVLDPGRERGLGHEPVAPDAVEQFLLGDHPVAMLDEEAEHVEDLGFGRHDLAVAADLASVGVHLVRAERVEHRGQSSTAPGRLPDHESGPAPGRRRIVRADGPVARLDRRRPGRR